MMIGTRIAERRKEKKLTQEVFAGMLGVSTAFISQIEGGVRKPSYGLLLKICHNLDTTIEYILSGETKGSDDPSMKLLSSAFSFLSPEKKDKLIDYLLLLTGVKVYRGFPVLKTPTEYAQFLIKHLKITEIPVDTFDIASKLEVEVIFADLDDCDGKLFKNREKPLIVLNRECDDYGRQRFTMAILLGHLVIPWHLQHEYRRVRDKRSLDHDELFEIEARQFAGELLLPSAVVKKDFSKLEPTIKSLEKLAYEKYKCSLTSIAHKLIEIYGKKYLYITSSGAEFTRVYNVGFPYRLMDKVMPGSIAYSFIDNPPSGKEIRKGVVDSKVWFDNVPSSFKVFEESMLDPAKKITVSLLKLEK